MNNSRDSINALSSNSRYSDKKKDFIDDCRENFLKDPRPRKIGNLHCLWYSKSNEPRIVVGPDWPFSLVEIVIANGISLYFLHIIDNVHHPWLYIIGCLTLLA
jgi:hypothetical protein